MQVIWHLGDVVRKMREYRSLTQRDLAELAGRHWTTILRVEDGGNSTRVVLDDVARALLTTTAALHGAIPSTTIVAEVEPVSIPGSDRSPQVPTEPGKTLEVLRRWFEDLGPKDQRKVRNALPTEAVTGTTEKGHGRSPSRRRNQQSKHRSSSGVKKRPRRMASG